MADPIVPITQESLTTKSIGGTGVFDVIMDSIQCRLDREFEKNRIKGSDYSKVYLGSMESCLNQSIAFLLGKDKASLEAELIAAQIKLLAQQASNEALKGKILLLEIEKAKLEVPKTEAEIALIKAKTITEYAGTKDLVDHGDGLGQVAVVGVIGAQKDKTQVEIKLLTEKVFTEKANTLDTRDASTPVAGTVGRKNALFEQQTKGFRRDAEQKMMKLMTDTWAVRQVNDVTDTPGTNLANEDVGTAVKLAMDGVKNNL